MVSATLVLNTVLVVLLQVRASRGVTSVSTAARTARRGAILLAASCLLFAGSSGISAWSAALVLVAAMTVQSLAEVLCSSAGWGLSYDLADPAAPGAYQGVFASGFALAAMLAPIVVTSTALRFGFAGWAILAGGFAAAGAALVPVSRWAAGRLPDTSGPGGSGRPGGTDDSDPAGTPGLAAVG
jgi:MFS family permease